jgi:hypothetical protein
MLGIMREGSRRRREARMAREEACIAAGCKCYCHEPEEGGGLSAGKFAFFFLVFGIFYGGFWWLMSIIQQQEQEKNPPAPYYCSGITATGAPTDCHPVVLPPEVLKQYEDRFKHRD